jgi:chromate reductase, NAD(P)H dehydrogenase (quinone)
MTAPSCIRLLAISGSLRAVSLNTALLEAAARLAPRDLTVARYHGLDELPHFNPDLDVDVPPPAVAWLRAQIKAADGLLISTPEYARGIPGSLKNALDWLVSNVDFVNKPVALFNASQRATDAQAALRLVLSTMSARVLDAASITLPLLGAGLDAPGIDAAGRIAADPTFAPPIRGALAAFLDELRS